MPDDLNGIVKKILRYPNIAMIGIGANLACRSGVSPDDRNMAQLSAIADSIEATFDVILGVISGGNSANLNWTLDGKRTTRVNHLRLGESILLGREPLHRQPIEGCTPTPSHSLPKSSSLRLNPRNPGGKSPNPHSATFRRSKRRRQTTANAYLRRFSPSDIRTRIQPDCN